MMITRKTTDSIELKWLPPSDLNGKIGYYLHYKKTFDPGSGSSFPLSGDTHLKRVTGLKPFTDYLFTVTAFNLRKNLRGPRTSVPGTTLPAGMISPCIQNKIQHRNLQAAL